MMRWAISIAVVVSAMGCASSESGQENAGAPIDDAADGGQWVAVQGPLDGPATDGDWASAIAESHVQCELGDIESDDLGDELSTRVPGGKWESRPSESADRCGDDYETILYRLHNCERQRRGLEPLQCDKRLVWAGRDHSRDMLDRGFFDHRSPEGVDPGQRLEKRGVQWRMTAENLAMAPTMALAHSGWMQSEGHRVNILRGEATHVGIGVIRSERGYVMAAVYIKE